MINKVAIGRSASAVVSVGDH